MKAEKALAYLRANSNKSNRFTAQQIADEADNSDRSHINRVLVWAMSHPGDVKRDTTSRPYEYWVD